MKYTADLMREELDKFGEKYEFPVYAVVTNLTGFFASSANMFNSFAALTDYSIIISGQSMMDTITGSFQRFEISKFTLTDIKIKKSLGGITFVVDLKYTVENKKCRHKLTIAKKVGGENFADQFDNRGGFISTLQQWAKEI